MVSSTSWTDDEDFNILLEALRVYNESWTPAHPHLYCVITGKGPRKNHYMQLFASEQLVHVDIASAWVDQSDYATLIACADFGVSLHQSSSGLDLPMKILDMFGCGVPVLALNFPCISELVVHGTKYSHINNSGLVFGSGYQLGRQMVDLFGKNGHIYSFVIDGGNWDANWLECMAPFV